MNGMYSSLSLDLLGFHGIESEVKSVKPKAYLSKIKGSGRWQCSGDGVTKYADSARDAYFKWCSKVGLVPFQREEVLSVEAEHYVVDKFAFG